MEADALIFQRVKWTPDAQLMLARALGSDLEEIKREVEKGVSRLWRVAHASGETSFFVTRPDGRELVLVAYEGCALIAVSLRIIDAARRQGFTTIRAHTKCAAVLRMLQELNPQVEYVARFNIGALSDGRQKQIDNAAAAADNNDQCTGH